MDCTAGATCHLRALVVEALQEALQQLVCVVDPLGVLANDPDHGGAGVGLVQRVEVLAQGGDDALVPAGHRGLGVSSVLVHVSSYLKAAVKEPGRWGFFFHSVLVGVLAEDVPDDHNGLLHHVVHLCLDQVQQGADATLSRLLEKKNHSSHAPFDW